MSFLPYRVSAGVTQLYSAGAQAGLAGLSRASLTYFMGLALPQSMGASRQSNFSTWRWLLRGQACPDTKAEAAVY